MTTITLTRGLPGSGKSTFARQFVAESPDTRVRVNRDDIRHMLFGKYWGVDENTVTRAEEALVKSALTAGKDVIVDATHLRAQFVKRWHKVGPVKIIDFPTPVDVCVANDAARAARGERAVGEDVIRSLAQRFGIKPDGTLPPRPVLDHGRVFRPAPEWNPSLPEAFIVDIDGTLANLGHRSPYAKDDAEYAADGVYEDVASLVRHLGELYHIVCVSGREDRFQEVTATWLRERCCVTPDGLHMRATGDMRSDDIVKSDIFDQHIAGQYNVVGVIDDRPRVLRMWRQKGLTTYRVGDIDADF